MDQKLNNNKSHTGLREIIYYLNYKILLIPFCIGIPDMVRAVTEILGTAH
jgi:uncharacterized metal-binding protein